MQVVILPTADSACDLVATTMERQVRRRPDSVLGLATGRSMEMLYDKLVQKYIEAGLDFSKVRTYNLDEYIGIPPEHEGSYRTYMNEKLFSKVNIDINNTHLPLGNAPDIKEECKMYEWSIKANGGIDLQILGIGKTGHIGFNEPLSALKSRTRDKSLTPETIRQNQALFKNPDDMPRRAVTMGVGTILEARHIVLLATGDSKAEILAKAIEGPITSMISATALQLHENCTIVADEEAASKLQCKDYYNWVFENEPDWQEFRIS